MMMSSFLAESSNIPHEDHNHILHPLKIIFERIFYFLLTQDLETKETTIFSPAHMARAQILLLKSAFSA